jgi:hypothetical protein
MINGGIGFTITWESRACYLSEENLQSIGQLQPQADYGQTAVYATLLGHPGLARLQQAVGRCYSHKYKKTGNPQDLEATLNFDLGAVVATTEGDPELPSCYRNLAVSYADRYRKAGDLQDVDIAIQYKLSAIALTPEEHSALPG